MSLTKKANGDATKLGKTAAMLGSLKTAGVSLLAAGMAGGTLALTLTRLAGTPALAETNKQTGITNAAAIEVGRVVRVEHATRLQLAESAMCGEMEGGVPTVPSEYCVVVRFIREYGVPAAGP